MIFNSFKSQTVLHSLKCKSDLGSSINFLWKEGRKEGMNERRSRYILCKCNDLIVLANELILPKECKWKIWLGKIICQKKKRKKEQGLREDRNDYLNSIKYFETVQRKHIALFDKKYRSEVMFILVAIAIGTLRF